MGDVATPTAAKGPHLSLHFRPLEGVNLFAVVKEEGGVKRRYLEGIASGIQVDGHGERMTERCIKSFQRQADSGDVLLYEGMHGVDFVDDIGRLVKSWIDETGNWRARFRLYDDQDGIGPVKMERVDTVWAQLNGLPPYTKPKQKGFSIEGEVPPGGLVSADQAGRRVMDDVDLEGVVLVNKPAYRDSIAHAVYKALGVPMPHQVRKGLEKTLSERLEAADETEAFYKRHYHLQDALDEAVRDIMGGPDVERRGRLEDLFQEYSSLAVDDILTHQSAYSDSPEPDGSDGEASGPGLVKLRELEGALKRYLALTRVRVGSEV
jgi:hypothetical protein